MEHIEIRPEMLQWAIRRSRCKTEDLVTIFPKLPEWTAGASYPTLKQLEAFAKETNTPIGYFFLTQPPEEIIPIPDHRRIITTRGHQG